MTNQKIYNYDTLYGPYRLDYETITKEVHSSALGNYLLSKGNRTNDGKIIISYVGRAHDEPVQSRLIDHLYDDKKSCKYFWVMYKKTAIDTYDQECLDYHDFMPSMNKEHPSCIPGSKRPCPHPGCTK